MKTTKAKVTGAIITQNKYIRINLWVILFEDNNSQIAYCPALNVYGYGATESEARDSFETCLTEFLDYALRKKTLEKELTSLGWTIKKEKKFTAPTFSKLLDSNSDLRKIMDTKDFRKINKNICLPAIA